MSNIRQLTSLILAFGLLAPGLVPLEARTKKGDKLLAKGKLEEERKNYEKALELYQQALDEDPSDTGYLIAVRRTRFQAGQARIDAGQKLREQGKLEEALVEFERALVSDPASSIAVQEIRRTRAMIQQERRKLKDPGGKPPPAPEERGLTPADRARREAEERAASLLPVPELKPVSRQITALKMNNQPVKVLFETVGKLAGINVIFDSEYQSQNRNFSIDLINTTLDQALDYVAILTKSYWKPLSPNAIFVTNDNVTKRRDYEDNIVKVFYLRNITSVQELQEIQTAVRSVTEIRRMFNYNALNAMVVRGTVDQVNLVEKLIQDLDKPKSEIVVDVIVMEVNRGRTRDLAAAITSGGKAGISFGVLPTGGASSGTGEDGKTGATGAGITALGKFGTLTENDWSVALPGAILTAVMSDRYSKVRQSPQLRVADGQKASIRLGERVPTATGSFQAGIATVGVSPLVNTQFQFIEVGVNVDVVPRVHGTDEVSLHVELEVSNVKDRIDIGGIEQPVIGQRKVVHDVRVKEGDVNLIGGIVIDTETRGVNGIPVLANLPYIGRLFGTESIERTQGELLIALIPHIVRSPDIDDVNMRGVAAGNDQSVRLMYAPREEEKPAAAPPAPGAPPAAPPVTVAAPETPGVKPAGPPPPPAKLSFQPEGVVTRVNSPVVLTLHVAGATDLFTAPAKLRYDPKMLRLVAVTPGVFLSGDGQRVNFNETRSDGEVSITLNRLPGSSGVSGSGALLTLTFQAAGAGKTAVSVAEIGLKNSQLQPIGAPLPSVEVEIR